MSARIPISGQIVTRLAENNASDTHGAITQAQTAFREWRNAPAPRRGELVWLLDDELRATKTALGHLVAIEDGKGLSEGRGEVQEMIAICDFAAGLSRQLYGLTIGSERPLRWMLESWHPLEATSQAGGRVTGGEVLTGLGGANARRAMVEMPHQCGPPDAWKSQMRPATNTINYGPGLLRAQGVTFDIG